MSTVHRRLAALAAAWVLLAVALLPPVESASTDLFAVHMAQHLLLGLAAPALVVLGAPLDTLGRLASPGTRATIRRVVHRLAPWPLRRRALGLGVAAALAHGGALWLWHAPALYDAALESAGLHLLQHATYLASGLFLWWAVTGAGTNRQRGTGVIALFLAALPAGALGALLAMAPRPLYAAHELADQQLAGAIMWVPGGLVYLVAAAVIVVRWLTDEHERMRGEGGREGAALTARSARGGLPRGRGRPPAPGARARPRVTGPVRRAR